MDKKPAYEELEQKIAQVERNYRTLLENIESWVWKVDKHGVYTYASPHAESIMGYTISEIIGKTPFDFMSAEEAGRVRALFLDIASRGERIVSLEDTMIRKDGAEVVFETNATPIFDEAGEHVGYMGTCADITEKKLAEKEKRDSEARLRQAQRLESIGNLAGGIAHDFNNLLFPIIGMSELLLEDLPEESPLRDNVHEILKAGKRGGELVKQILAFSRQSERGAMPLRIQPLLKETLKLSRASIPSNIELENDVQNDCGLVVTDPTQIQQIVMNLITNAYHAVEMTGGRIAVQLKQVSIPEENPANTQLASGKYAMLTVSDTGYGIEPQIIDKIFEPYFTTKERGKGTGLGLAVVYGIVKEHGGDITVRSEPGNGATFDVYLPVLEETREGEDAQAPGHLERGDERVLLIDDEVSVAKLERQMLVHLGYHVTEYYGATEALKTFAANPHAYDLVITDMTMPGMTGDRVAGELVQIRPDIPVIICTGFSEAMDERTAREIGIKGFLMKPFSTEKLAKLVRNVLDGAAS